MQLGGDVPTKAGLAGVQAVRDLVRAVGSGAITAVCLVHALQPPAVAIGESETPPGDGTGLTVQVARSLPQWPVPGGPLLLILKTASGEAPGVRYRYRLKPTDPWTDSPDGRLRWSCPAEGTFRVEIQAVDPAGRQSDPLVYERPIKAPSGPRRETLPANMPKTIVNSAGMYFVLVPAGEFAMGSSDNDDAAQKDEMPLHGVRITKPFYLGTVEVTKAD